MVVVKWIGGAHRWHSTFHNFRIMATTMWYITPGMHHSLTNKHTHTHINNVSKEGERFALSLLSVYIITLIHSRSLVTVHTADGFVHLFSSLINSHYAQKYLHTDTLTVTFSHALFCFGNQTSTTSLKSENL